MSEFATNLIYEIPWFAFAIIGLLTIAQPVLHLLLALARVLSGRAARIDWWVLGRILPLGVALAVLAPLTLSARNNPTSEQIALVEIAVIFLSVAAIIVPIALPLLQALVQRLPRVGTVLYTVLAVLALPVACAFATQAALYATNEVERAAPVGVTVTIPSVFVQNSTLSACKKEIALFLPEGFNSTPDASGDRGYRSFFLFWVDMTLKATFLDFFEVFDCGVTDLSNNPAHLLMSSFVFIYRAFVELIVLATVASLFLRVRES